MRPGDTILIYATGLGAKDGQGAAVNVPTVSIGGRPAQVTYAGAALRQPPSGPPTISGSVTLNSLSGLYQITAVAPGGVAAGAAAVTVDSVG